MIKVLLTLVFGVFLGACSNLNRELNTSELNTSPNNNYIEEPVISKTITSACDIIHYYDVISALTENQKIDTALALRSNAKSRGKLSDCNQIKLAILLSAPNSVLQDDKTSIDLLTDFVNNATSVTQADKTFASFLKQLVEERSLIRYQHTKTRDLLKLQQQQTVIVTDELAKTRQQLQQLKSLESELNHQEKRITSQPAS